MGETNQSINEAVARKLGWKEDLRTSYWIRETVAGVEGTRKDSLPDYCTSIAAAWEIVEYLRLKKKKTKPIFFLRGLTIQSRSNSRKWRVYLHGKLGIADTAPMAICLAFLKLP